MWEIGVAVAHVGSISSSLALKGESDSILQDTDLEKELAKLFDVDVDEDYSSKKLSGLNSESSRFDARSGQQSKGSTRIKME